MACPEPGGGRGPSLIALGAGYTCKTTAKEEQGLAALSTATSLTCMNEAPQPWPHWHGAQQEVQKIYCPNSETLPSGQYPILTQQCNQAMTQSGKNAHIPRISQSPSNISQT